MVIFVGKDGTGRIGGEKIMFIGKELKWDKEFREKYIEIWYVN